MDDEDYSWVRRTRFSQSIVRSSSGREQYGAFIEQFSRGAELRQNGLGTGYKHPRQTLQPPLAKGPGGVSNSARLPIPKAKSAVAQLERKLKHASSDGQLNRDRSGDRSSQESSAKQDRKGVVGLNLDIPQRHVVRPSKESPDALDFSFHSDEHSQRLQRVCSSAAPFFMKDATATADSCHSLFQLG